MVNMVNGTKTQYTYSNIVGIPLDNNIMEIEISKITKLWVVEML